MRFGQNGSCLVHFKNFLASLVVVCLLLSSASCSRRNSADLSGQTPYYSYPQPTPNPTLLPNPLAPTSTPTPTPYTDQCNLNDHPDADSAESLVDYTYCLMLDRAASPPEISQWAEQIKNARLSRTGFFLGVYESPEFQQRRVIGGVNDEVFVETMFRVLVDRSPNDVELKKYSEMLASGSARTDIIRSLIRLESFMETHPGYEITRCPELKNLANSASNAQPTLKTCIERTPDGGTLEIPPGKFTIEGTSPFKITRKITFRTENKDETLPKCKHEGDSTCAELLVSPKFAPTNGGAFYVDASNVLIDHIIFNGNNKARFDTLAGRTCSSGNNTMGFNLILNAGPFSMQNSVTKNALCGTGLGTGGAKRLYLKRNSVVLNGVHNRNGLWSDGVTVNDSADSEIVENYFRDNTDIDLIFGGCARCIIQDNTIEHSADTTQGAFAGLMIHAWADPQTKRNLTSGDYTGADISNNKIDCGSAKECGFGILLGSDPWYIAERVYGGVVHDNSVTNAQQGFTIDDVQDFTVYNNSVTNSGGNFRTNQGPRTMTKYSVSPNSRLKPVPAGKKADLVDSNAVWDFNIPNPP